MAHTIERLRKLSDAELIAEHDGLADYEVAGVDYYLNELARREQSRQAALLLQYTALLLQYTKILLRLTAIVTLATIISLAVVVIPIVVRCAG